jgi:centromeric protein E
MVVVSPNEVEALLAKGERNRHVGETNMNEHSSRSHTIFKMIIESRERGQEFGAVSVSCLNLVDLAGSERVGHTGAEGLRLKEGGHINKSLLALASVIAKLSEGNDRMHIPYRDSKLTRILQPSLGGNAKTAIICMITPSSKFSDESLSTLKFASRAKKIRNKPQLNQVISDEALLKKYEQEIKALKSTLQKMQTTEQDMENERQERVK